MILPYQNNSKPKKIVVVGEGGIGKTTLVKSYIQNAFYEESKQTIAVQFHTHNVKVKKENCRLQVWDFGGQEHFKQMGLFKDFCKGSDGAILCFDATDISTLFSLSEWLDFIDNSIPKILVGTKIDLDPHMREDIDLEPFAKKFGCDYYCFCSSKDLVSIRGVFKSLLDIITHSKCEKREILETSENKIEQSIILFQEG